MNQLAQVTDQAYQQYCEAYNSLSATSEETNALWQAYKELKDQAMEEVFGKEEELVHRPAEIQTVSFEMGGKMYRTVSSWSLLD